MRDIKTCVRCKEKKSLKEFTKDAQRKDGRRCYCKLCDAAMSRQYHQNNLEAVLIRRRRYREHCWATGRIIYHILKSNKRSPVMFTVDEVIEWYSKQALVCYYCGRNLVPGRGLNSRTIDRKNNSKPYDLDNMVLCCKQCNVIKGSWFTETQMIEIAEKYLRKGVI